MRIQRITTIRIDDSTTDWRGGRTEPCLELVDDEYEVVASLPISELAEALAPYLCLQIKVRNDT